MVARISTLLAVASLFLAPLASANPIEEKRQHSTEWAPPIISPVGGDVWTIGQQASVTWDASHRPAEATTIREAGLYKSEYGAAIYIATLASDIPSDDQTASFTVPSVEPGSYFVELGAWGNANAGGDIQVVAA